jgi:hypothetical protein
MEKLRQASRGKNLRVFIFFGLLGSSLEEAVTATDTGNFDKSEQIRSKKSWLRVKRLPDDRSVALIPTYYAAG